MEMFTMLRTGSFCYDPDSVAGIDYHGSGHL
jgi:hypothetical protein